MIIKSVFLLFLVISAFQFARAAIENCDKTIAVRSFNINQEYTEICSSCQDSYFLTDDFSQCIRVVANQDPLRYCARASSRFLCQEAEGCYVLQESSHLITQIKNDYCAVISDDLSTCMIPKFGYTFVIPQKTYNLVDQRMCAVFNSSKNICEKYYYRFLPVEGQDYSVFLQNFINFDKITKESHSKNIICQQPYILSSDQKKFGCILQEIPSVDKNNCEKYNENNECEVCKSNFAINSQNGLCEPFPYTYQGCQIQQVVGLDSKCLKCYQGYMLYEGYCKEVKNCKYFNNNYPFDCLACASPYYSNFCLDTRIINNCEILGYSGYCLKCQNNELYYTDGDQCILRSSSLNCKEKSPIGDYCNSFTDQAGYYFEMKYQIPEELLDQYSYKLADVIILQQTPITLFDRNLQYFKSIGVKIAIGNYYQLKQSTPVEGCTRYSIITDACLECQEGKYLQVSHDDVYTCTNQIPPTIEGCQLSRNNNNCVRCNEYYTFDSYTKTCIPVIEKNCLYNYKNFNGEPNCLQCPSGYVYYESKKQCLKYENCSSIPSTSYDGCMYCLSGSQFMYTLKIEGGTTSKCVANIKNCKTVVNGTCLECFSGYTYNTTTQECFTSDKFLNCEKSPDSTICSVCNASYILQNGVCISQCLNNNCTTSPITNCLNPICDPYNTCTQCQIGYIFYTRCDFQCIDGTTAYDQSQCKVQPTCNSQCKTCLITNPNYCTSCQDKTVLNDGKCDSQCPIGEFFSLILNSCQKCPPQCLTCSSPDKCTTCHSSAPSIDNNCCDSKCKTCQPTDPNYCTSCQDSKYLTDGKCESQCPIGEYISVNDYSCQKCPPQCQSCLSPDKCTSCQSSATSIDNNCLCKDGNVIHRNKCLKNCPFSWTLNAGNQTCERSCLDDNYLEYNEQIQKYECNLVSSDSSNYCTQLIQQIPNLVNLRLKKVTDQDQELTLNIIFSETPLACYTYKLIGQLQYEIPLTPVQAPYPNQISFDMKVPKSDILNPEKVKSQDGHSYLNFQIFYKEYLQFTVRVTITHNFTLILSNDFEYVGEHAIIDPVCEECEIPVEKQVSQSTTVTCPTDTSCDQKKISVYTNAVLQVTQIINDPLYLKSTVLPHSIKIKVTSSSGKEDIILIKNYSYDNTQPGKIIYTFSAIGSSKGILVVTSKAIAVKSRLLESSTTSNPYKYSTGSFEIEIKDEEEEESTQKIILISCVCAIGSILLIICMVILYRYLKAYQKRKQNKKLQTVFPNDSIDQLQKENEKNEVVFQQISIINQ